MDILRAVADGRAAADNIEIKYFCSGGMGPRDEITLYRDHVTWKKQETIGGQIYEGTSEASVPDEVVRELVGDALGNKLWEIEPRREGLVPDQRNAHFIIGVTGNAATLLPEPEERQHPVLMRIKEKLFSLVGYPNMQPLPSAPIVGPPPGAGGPPVAPPAPAPAAPPKTLLGQCIDFLEADGWPYEVLEREVTLVRCLYAGKSGDLVCWFQARDDLGQLMFYTRPRSLIPPEKRLSVAELVTRANYGMIIGGFELDLNDGEVRFKVCVDVEGIELTHRFLKNMSYTAVVNMDRYYPGILRVVETDTPPAAVIAEIENSR